MRVTIDNSILKDCEKTFPVYVVDAFTTGDNQAYTGNSAAVVILNYDDEIPDETKQKLATSMNLSETAFVAWDWTKPENGDCGEPGIDDHKTIKRTIRWFSLTQEFDLCGHATVASVKALLRYCQDKANSKELVVEKIEFKSKFSGNLFASIKKQDDAEVITIDLPVNLPKSIDPDSKLRQQITEVLFGASLQWTDVLEDVLYSPTIANYLLVVMKPTEDPERTLRNVSPNFVELKKLGSTPEYNPGAIFVTIQAREEDSDDFYARTFAPYFGVNEDPACGSAHTLLAPYWVEKLGKEGQVLHTMHVSARGGKLQVLWKGDRVLMGGTARVVIKGEVIP
ncbi:unnamed protein product [Allacma fusca]|uniref:Phenazine biosynthesis PhzC/PhzF protein n=1 Tax=Allacma fusca TaxID=39272 RepID=A0A8J2PLC7_9HEXA|nr:unnamed protein product [Allacma fusca]